MRVHYARPIAGRAEIQSQAFLRLLQDYQETVIRLGYHPKSIRLALLSITHFGVWLEREGRALETSNGETVKAFEQHLATCRCPDTSRNRDRQVGCCVRRFLQHLRSRGASPSEVLPQLPSVVQRFLRWIQAERGVSESTLTSYGGYAADLVRMVGDNPQAYTASSLRHFVEQRCRRYRRSSSRMVVAAVRMFLRYLAIEDQCRPGLEHALIPLAQWSQQPLPRGLSAADIQRVLDACPTSARGRRDRAVLLLMLRLGLRASEVARLRLADLSFATATIDVSGKGRCAVRLPLPQEVGNALLDYLRAGRPPVPNECVFLRSLAPFVPFSTRPGGNAVGAIARAALTRAGVQIPTRGAHVFRHTAACQMLRHGVDLEDIAKVLRHRSVETTGIYAKVDVALLRQVAQPWPEVLPC
jgi:site-specific recombinase XerD